MKKKVLAILVFAVAYLVSTNLYTRTLAASDSEAKLVQELLAKKYYGERMDADHWHWVKVVNVTMWLGWIPNPFNGDLGITPFPFGQTCGVGSWHYEDGYKGAGGIVRARGEARGRVLYEYTARWGNPGQTSCPSGILFFDKEEGGR